MTEERLVPKRAKGTWFLQVRGRDGLFCGDTWAEGSMAPEGVLAEEAARASAGIGCDWTSAEEQVWGSFAALLGRLPVCEGEGGWFLMEAR